MANANHLQNQHDLAKKLRKLNCNGAGRPQSGSRAAMNRESAEKGAKSMKKGGGLLAGPKTRNDRELNARDKALTVSLFNITSSFDRINLSVFQNEFAQFLDISQINEKRESHKSVGLRESPGLDGHDLSFSHFEIEMRDHSNQGQAHAQVANQGRSGKFSRRIHVINRSCHFLIPNDHDFRNPLRVPISSSMEVIRTNRLMPFKSLSSIIQ
jgi:hypothetical protein